DAGWVRHATGTLAPAGTPTTTPPTEHITWPPPGRPLDLTHAYDELTTRGYTYGPLFQGLTALWHDGDDLYAEVSLPHDTDTTGHTLHPALLDAALH
ncbi:polyketide synthase dehydratase domain-containing protein, partial [Streptomyces atroolivaceus]